MKKQLLELIGQIDEIETRFELVESKGFPTINKIYTDLRFCEWKAELELELQQIYNKKRDRFIWDALSILRQGFNGWNDEKSFVQIRGKLLAIEKNIDLYYETEPMNMVDTGKVGKMKKVFISHSSGDKDYVEKIVELLTDIGMRSDQIFCSSIPGHGIPIGEDIYDYLRKEFVQNELCVIFVLSQNYYNSVPCLNEMGAAWVLQNKYYAILLPGFSFSEIEGAVNPRKIALKLDDDERELKEKLGELKRKFIDDYSLSTISDVKWEEKRDKFIKDILLISSTVTPREEERQSVEDDLILTEKGVYIKRSEQENGQMIRYCVVCYKDTGQLYPIVRGSLRKDHFCSKCRTHYSF